MRMPDAAGHIIKTLRQNGYEAYIVGGCVRDMLLHREPKDWDITTSARPDEIKRLFRRTVDTGIEHGTVTVLIGSEGYEVTTYRIDGKYEDHRHPDSVTYTTSLEEDLKRRDFTINAMAYSDEDGIVDLFLGQQDLKDGVIRCVGDPGERFEEDALRMLRGVRFAGQLGFDIEDETYRAMCDRSATIANVSAERIQVELSKLIISKGADKIRLAYEAGLTRVFFPEFDKMMECEQHNPHHCYTVGEHTIHVIEGVNSLIGETGIYDGAAGDNRYAVSLDKLSMTPQKLHIALAYAALLHDVAKPVCLTTDEAGVDHYYGHDVKGEELAGQFIRRMKLDNDTRRLVKALVRYHDVRYKYCVDDEGNYSPGGKRAMRRLVNKVGRDVMVWLFVLQRADIYAQSEYRKEEKLHVLEAGIRCFEEICEDADAVDISELAITGRDLIEEKGYTTGPDIGRELNRLLDLVMDDPGLNTREGLMELVK